MKRYAAFAGDAYYPLGGWEDLKGLYEDFHSAMVAATPDNKYGWGHVVDLHDGAKYDAPEFGTELATMFLGVRAANAAAERSIAMLTLGS